MSLTSLNNVNYFILGISNTDRIQLHFLKSKGVFASKGNELIINLQYQKFYFIISVFLVYDVIVLMLPCYFLLLSLSFPILTIRSFQLNLHFQRTHLKQYVFLDVEVKKWDNGYFVEYPSSEISVIFFHN